MSSTDVPWKALPRLDEFDYNLPDASIAAHPLKDRSQARLLVYQDGAIQHRHFGQLEAFLPARSMLISNNTRVVRARLEFQRKTGGRIEVFCLDPVAPHTAVEAAMQATGTAIWRCMVRNLKKWKPQEPLVLNLPALGGALNASLMEREEDKALVRLSWSPAKKSFAEVLEAAGKIPLPPYLQREAMPDDDHDYQTVYASRFGAVAAPTAGLHFSQAQIEQLQTKGHAWNEVTLHVSAGTFQPVTTNKITDHPMHQEEVVVSRPALSAMLQHEGPWVSVGTTSLRTVESLYWYGHQLLHQDDPPGATSRFFIPKRYPYHFHPQTLPTRKEAFGAVRHHMDRHGLDVVEGRTEIFIFPGYPFRATDALITNFHQPRSTLIMLIAAWVGQDWKRIYQEALHHKYRFLSYGDGCLLFPAGSAG